MICPPYLEKGSTIGITATASHIARTDIQKSLNTIEEWGFKAIVSDTVGSKFHQYAAKDEERLSEFQNMLDDQDIDAIFCARGGYGTVRIIDKIDFSNFSKTPKWIVGFSDVTVLHSHINNILGIETIHGPMPKTFSKSEVSNSLLYKYLVGNIEPYSITGNYLNVCGKSRGVLTGGNLSIIHSLIGSISDFNPENKILLIEDIGEYLYNIDRMIWGIKRAKDLTRLAGIIVGNFSDTKDNETSFGKTVNEIVLEHFSELKIPICFNFPSGHDDENYPLYLGRMVNLNVGKESVVLEFE